VTNCEFCDVKNWDYTFPELIINEEHLKNETFYLSGLFFDSTDVKVTDIQINIEYHQKPFCPEDCSSKGKCLNECICDFGFTGKSCKTKINKLPLDSNKADLLPGHSWTFFYTKLQQDKNYIHVEFDDFTSKDLHVYLMPSGKIDNLPSFRSNRKHIGFPEKQDMMSRFFLQEKYLIWGFFCTSHSACPFKLELEIKGHDRRSFFWYILVSSTVLVFSFIGMSFVGIKAFKKLKRKCCLEEENERLIAQHVMNQCFPQHYFRLVDQNNDTCCICLNNFSDEKVRTLGCFHNFHSACIDIWTATHNSCPLCKKSIFLSDELLRVSPSSRSDRNRFQLD
jgi:hypothetical protein